MVFICVRYNCAKCIIIKSLRMRRSLVKFSGLDKTDQNGDRVSKTDAIFALGDKKVFL